MTGPENACPILKETSLENGKECVREWIERAYTFINQGDWKTRAEAGKIQAEAETTHMVRHCFPQAWHFLKAQSILKAALGRYPKSSRRVNKGKKIAIGGSMTDTIQATER